MLIRPPGGEPRQVLVDVARVGVEDVRAVLVDQHTGLVIVIVGVAGDVRALVADQYRLAGMGREALRDCGPGKAGADDEIIEHGIPVQTATPPASPWTSAGRSTSSINLRMRSHVPSHDVWRRKTSACVTRSEASSAMAASHAATNDSGSSAMRTNPCCP